MLSAFQILLMLLLFFMSLYLIGDPVKENKFHYSIVVIVTIFAMCFMFYLGD